MFLLVSIYPFQPSTDRHAGEVINSMRLSEARLLLARYKRNKKKNGAAVASAPALAVDLKNLPPEAAAAGAGGGAGSAEGEGSATGGAAGGVPATATHAMEQGLMKLVEKAVMALTEVGRIGMSTSRFPSSVYEP